MADTYPLICDSGTGYLKIGFSNKPFPEYSLPALLGRPVLRFEEKIDNVELKDVMIADEAAPLRSFLEINYPIEEGIVNSWEDMTLLWDYAFKKTNVDPANTKILMTEPVMNPISNRQKMAEIVFEKFGFAGFQVGIQALLSLYAEGLLTSTLLDSGDGVTHCIPVVDGIILNHLITRMNIAGRHVTKYLNKLLLLRGYAFNSTADFELVREIKEKFCFVSAELQEDRKLARETTCLEKEYKLPDGSFIKIGKERFEAAEILFNPFVDGHDFNGVSDIVFEAINKAPMDTRKALYNSIMISGGTSMLPGFPNRLENDIKKLYKHHILKGKDVENQKVNIQIIDTPRRKYNVFIGGGVFANAMKNRHDFWISKKDYEEYGINCIKKISDNLQM